MTPETIPDATGSTPVAWQDGQPFSPRYGDRYHTQSGARAQAEHVFLGGCGLPGAWSGRPPERDENDLECGPSGNLPDLGNDRNADTPSVPSGPACWTILETGFGLGLNFLSAWACWQASPARPATLRFVSTEAHPVSWPMPGRMPQHWPHGTRETPTTRLPVTPMPNRKHPERGARPRGGHPGPCHPVCRIPPLRMPRKRRPA